MCGLCQVTGLVSPFAFVVTKAKSPACLHSAFPHPALWRPTGRHACRALATKPQPRKPGSSWSQGVLVSGSLNGVDFYNSAGHVRAAPVGGMDLTMLGTAAAYPCRHRNVSASVLRLEAHNSPMRVWLFDCGEGTQRQATQANMSLLTEVDRVFITHLHGDHVFGLLGLLATRAARFLQTNSNELHIYGPRGLAAFLASASNVLHQTPVVVHELLQPLQSPSVRTPPTPDGLSVHGLMPDPDGTWSLMGDEHYTVSAGSVKHTVPCVAYVVEERATKGMIDVAAATAAGLPPSRLYADLKDGRSVTTSEGKVIRPEDVVRPGVPGRKVAILGDTSNPWGVRDLVSGADLLVHEATVFGPEAAAAKKQALANGHSTPEMAGEFAKAVGARRLVLNHFSHKECSGAAEALLAALPSTDRAPYKKFPLAKDFKYPDVKDPSFMGRIMKAARKAGIPKVAAARDFMAFPVPHTGSK